MPLTVDPIQEQADIPMKNKPTTLPKDKETYADVFALLNIFRVLFVAIDRALAQIVSYINSAGWLTDAPSDGVTYGRKNGAWADVRGSINTVKLRVHLGTATNTTSAGWQKVPVDIVALDSSGCWNAANERAVIPVSGVYQISGRVYSSTAGSTTIAVYVNGSNRSHIGGAASSVSAQGGYTLLSLAAGDYVELYMSTNTVRALAVGAVETWLTINGPI